MLRLFEASSTAALLLLILEGCAAIRGFPDPITDSKSQLESLKLFLGKDASDKYLATSDSDRGGMTKKQWRNEVLEARVRAADLKYGDFERGLYSQGVGYGVGTDWAVLALTGAASVSTGNAPKYLAALAAGFTGAQAAYAKGALFDKTLPALMAQMQASRETILVRIRQGEGEETDAYPFSRGLQDAGDYENAGSIPSAINGVTTSAGSQLKQATDALNAVQVVTAAPPDVQARREKLSTYVRDSTKVSSDALSKLVTALGKTVDVNRDKNVTTILYAIAAANTADQFNILAQKVKILFGEDF